MTNIPSAEDIRKVVGIQGNEDIGKFNAFTTEALANFINENVVRLQAGKSAFFKFPVLRDMGNYKRLWERDHDSFVNLLREKGYWCKRDLNAGDVVIEIALREDLTRLRRNAGQ